MMIIRPSTFAKIVEADPLVLHEYKTRTDIPMEVSPEVSDTQRVLLTHPQIPSQSHARDHFFSYNEEQVALVLDVLREFTGTVDAEFAKRIGHTVVTDRVVSFGNPSQPTVVHQLKIALQTPVPSRRVWLRLSDEDKVHLVRRHGSTPGLDFSAPVDETTMPFITMVDTMIITLRVTDPSAPQKSFTLGTAFAGTTFPGSEENDGTGILYKWYPSTPEGNQNFQKDAELFWSTIRGGNVPALLEPTAFFSFIVRDA